ncbi:RHS repeat-associated core domain-containing protein [Sorangium sp. So ce1036]|uniref:RHS repeat domain-containing protein n=1 Tax=Sorangium sp. So ce1036 TaxID=3133328 RepID=UPI003F0AD974
MDPDWFRDPPTIYYHPDHLGSTSFASNNEQALTQRDEYFPSGELWIDASDSRYELRRAYVFTGKELDQATGLYYFGARYYDPRINTWLSPDPILDEYMAGGPGAGVFNPGNLGLYSYTLNNPVNLVDPDGRQAQGAHRNFAPGANGCRHPSCFTGPEGAAFHQKQLVQRMNSGASSATAAAMAGRASRGVGDAMRRVLFRLVAQQQAVRPPAPAAAPAQPAQAAQPAPAAQPAQAAQPAKPPQSPQPAKPPQASKGGGWAPPAEASAKIPSSWGASKSTRKGVGVRWQDPKNQGNGVRIDRGNLNNSQSLQQVDHVVVNSNGRIIGPDGKPIAGALSEHPNAHIPLSQWLKWKSWNSP